MATGATTLEQAMSDAAQLSQSTNLIPAVANGSQSLGADYTFERRLYKSPLSGKELRPIDAGQEAGITKEEWKQLKPAEQEKILTDKNYSFYDERKYHIGEGENSQILSEKEMAQRLGLAIKPLRAVCANDLYKSYGVTAIEPVDGRLPINSRWAGRHFPLDQNFVRRLINDYPYLKDSGLENGVEFVPEGYPNFSDFAKKKIQVKFTGNRDLDEEAANELLDYRTTPQGYTWHHCPDGETLELLPTPLHDKVRHTGGHALAKTGA